MKIALLLIILAGVMLTVLVLTGCQSSQDKANDCAVQVQATYSATDEDSLLTQTLDQCGDLIEQAGQ